ncbi:MAG: polyhydroxyalkanoate synthesis repressor PhaR [Alphaproteobacteria bacterium]|nr:polyhydroxyalkanoate synthesis repressor PhaR [Alphaproteobacteria bacterium]MCK5623575.1 polyhydroxyalkanoate synthesis repressor PhaR [Alphaproteobacteria bacterium]
MAEKGKGGDGPITIKKYANRRLYNTATSSYVTLDHLCQMVKDDVDFAVYDAKTGEDITRSVLTQIIVEEEAKGDNLLPIGFLRQLIGFYGDSVQKFMLPQYLDYMMQSFEKNQSEMQRYMHETFGSVFPFGKVEDMGKQNMAMFEQAMKMFSGAGEAPAAEKASPKEAQVDEKGEQLAELQRKLEDLERQIGSLSDRKGD